MRFAGRGRGWRGAAASVLSLETVIRVRRKMSRTEPNGPWAPPSEYRTRVHCLLYPVRYVRPRNAIWSNCTACPPCPLGQIVINAYNHTSDEELRSLPNIGFVNFKYLPRCSPIDGYTVGDRRQDGRRTRFSNIVFVFPTRRVRWNYRIYSRNRMTVAQRLWRETCSRGGGEEFVGSIYHFKIFSYIYRTMFDRARK